MAKLHEDKFNYVKKDLTMREANPIILEEDDDSLSGIDLAKLSPEDAEIARSALKTLTSIIDKAMANGAYRKFLKKSIKR